ncbi:MAG TPA: tyrosine-type recombinase/integrase [Verrucomicrobiae bacterium]|nr:tyrosine-type recombinase/integrase [Verrucomicrobiae bacterium]
MKQRFRLYRRSCTGRFYIHDGVTGKQESLGTSDRTEAVRLLHSKNEADRQPAINLQIARAYLAAGDPSIATRTWQVVIDELVKTKQQSSTRQRYERGYQDQAFDSLRALPILQTRPEHYLHALEVGTVSTNDNLRRLHNFALAMTWLPWPVLTKKQWPALHYRDKRGITWGEHQAIVAGEKNPERKAFFELAWHMGAAQIDLVSLKAEDVDWPSQLISYKRRKTGTLAILRFGEEVASILKRLPATGPLFPSWSKLSSSDRAARFANKCKGLGITGVSLHSYRYAWAERAKTAGYPERYAQEALGHKSKAVHRAYAKKARVELPSLESYERKIVPLPTVSAAIASANGSTATPPVSEVAHQASEERRAI